MTRGHGSAYRGRGYRRSVSLKYKSRCNESRFMEFKSRFISLTVNNQDKCTKSNPGQKLSNFPNSVQPSHSRKVKMFFKKLAKNNRRSLYSPNSSRLQTRVQYPTITKATSSMFNREQKDSLNQEIQKLIKKGAIQSVHQEQTQFLSYMFLVSKKDGENRPVKN